MALLNTCLYRQDIGQTQLGYAFVRRVSTVFLAGFMAASTAFAYLNPDDDDYPPPEIMEVIIIEGSFGTTDGGESGGAGGASIRYMDQLSPPEEIAFRGDPRKDVRCSPQSSVRETTSQHGIEHRYLAAVAMYKIFVTPMTVFQRRALRNLAFEVTYADGGRESWLVVLPDESTMPLKDQPLPNSLVVGSGTPQPGPVCAQG